MERDNEVKGSGNSYTSHFRQYDPRLGRWMSDEPKPVAWESGYAAFRNNPIYYADPTGDWPKWIGGKGSKKMKKTPGQKRYAGERYKYGKNDKAHPVSGKKNAEIQTEKQKAPNKINWDMSGYLTKGGFVTVRYLSNLAEKAGEPPLSSKHK